MLSGERSVVVLQQPHQIPTPIVSVRKLSPSNSWGFSRATGGRLASVQSTHISHLNSSSGIHLPRSDICVNTSNANRESSWRQYVKQFAKLGPCPICGDRISGYHYGIFCCESCKGFFKRTVQNAKRYSCHMATPSSLCDITAASRKKCPACRFVKCLEKGMRMEAIRSDRTRGGRSMYPGSRYLRQLAARVSGTPGLRNSVGNAAIAPFPSSATVGYPHSLASTTLSSNFLPMTLGPNGLPSSEDVGGGVYLDPAILDDSTNTTQGKFSDDFGKDIRPLISAEMPKLLFDVLKLEESIEAEPPEVLDFSSSEHFVEATLPPNVTVEEAAVYRALLSLADQRLYRIVRWSRALPVFANLDTDDQILLLQNCWADLLCLDCCWKSLPTPNEIRLTSSKCINLEAAREMGAGDLVASILQLTCDLKRLDFNLIDFACLKVVLLMQPDLPNLKAVRQVKQFQESITQILMDYNSSPLSNVSNKFTELLIRIPELQRTSTVARELMADKDLRLYLSTNSLLMELLRSDFHRHPSMMVDSESMHSMTNLEDLDETLPSDIVDSQSAVESDIPVNKSGSNPDFNSSLFTPHNVVKESVTYHPGLPLSSREAPCDTSLDSNPEYTVSVPDSHEF